MTAKEADLDADERGKREFEKRLKERDAAKIKEKNDRASAGTRERKEEIQRRKLVDDLTGKLKDGEMNRLRLTSRQVYLEKREKQKIDQLGFQLQLEEEMFADQKMSKEEEADLSLKRKLVQIIGEKQKLATGNEEVFQIPQAYDDLERDAKARAKRYDVVHQRYREKGREHTSYDDQRDWEESKIHQALAHEKKGREFLPTPEHELLLEDAVEFVTGQMLAGKMELPEFEDEATAREKARLALLEAKEQMREIRKSLPIYKYKQELLDIIAANSVIVMVGETGSGKTTQVAQYLYEAGYCKDLMRIGCTQPRRVAAMSVAARVAQEMDVKLGREVGYSIRFEDCTCDKTVIKYMTDGMLLREFLTEPDIASYSVMIIDEAHERSLHTDILFGLVKDVARFRPDLKVIISSATLESQKFSEYFDNAPVIEIPGRRYPVSINYTKAPEANYLEAIVITTLQIHLREKAGDILIFLTGQDEIEDCNEMLMERTKGMGTKMSELILVPIYSTLPTEMQSKIFEVTPPGARKVVIATNIAETSLTIDGIVYVIDSGFCKQKSYNPRSGMESLTVVPISKANAMQRAGRAGRTCPGKCFRIYTAWSFKHELEDSPLPEIQRTNLNSVVLLLKSLGIHDLIHFDFMDPPPAETLIRALEQLYALGALNDRGNLTKLGRRMAEFPLDPQMSKALVASEKYGCSENVMNIASMLGVGNSIFYCPKDKKVLADAARKNFFKGGGDHLALLNCYEEWVDSDYSTSWCYENYVQVRSMKRARDIRAQLEVLLDRVEIELTCTEDTDQIRKAIVSGYFFHSARLSKDQRTYRTVKNPQTVYTHPSSHLHVENPPPWVIYHELVLTNKEFMRNVMELDPKWLIEIAPHYYKGTEIEVEAKKMPKGKGRSNAAD